MYDKKKKKVNQVMGPHLDAIPFKNADIKKIMMNRGVSKEGTQGSVFKTKKPYSGA